MLVYDVVNVTDTPYYNPFMFCLNNNGDAGGVGGNTFGPHTFGVIWFKGGELLTLNSLPNASGINAINDAQVAVGSMQAGSATSTPTPILIEVSSSRRGRPFLTVTDLSELTGPNATCTGINNTGLVCGYNYDPGSKLPIGGFVIDPANKSGVIILLPPGRKTIQLLSIDDAGDVVAISLLDPMIDEFNPPPAYIFRKQDNYSLPSIFGAVAPVTPNTAPRINAGQIAGFDDGSGQAAIFDTKAGTYWHVPLPEPYANGESRAINDQGVIVGDCWTNGEDDDDPPSYSFIFDGSTSVLLGDLIRGSGYGQDPPIAINNAGQILLASGNLLTPRFLEEVNPQLV